jgi:FkbM family methyltransferase
MVRNLARLIRSIPSRLARRLRDPIPQPLRDWLARVSELSVVDIGANRGRFLSDLLRRRRVVRAWLVEPQQVLANQLVATFPAPRFTVHRVALSDYTGEARLEISRGADETASLLPIRAASPQLSHLPLGEQFTEACPVDTLDHFAEMAGVGPIDLLKADTQGNELQVFRGGAALLARTQAVWVELSVVQLYDGACLIPEVVDCLHSHKLYLRGLAPDFRGPEGELLQVNGLFTRQPMPK